MQSQPHQEVITTPIFNITDKTPRKGELPPYQKYPVGYKFNMLDRGGTIVEMKVKRYIPASKEFIVDKQLDEIIIQDNIPLLKLEELTDPHLDKYPVGTNVNVPRSDNTVSSGIMAGYDKSIDKYMVYLPGEKGIKLKTVEPKILDAINFRGKVKELLQ